ncbi:MFS transporter [Vreelandella alkaliphila]|uniref:MFS transporter n=1 Tax=Gammaproteobacteria TaxID=1236 RepID=UPI001D025C73|nr:MULTISPECIES: MFS transporter [Halomonas]
MYTHELSGQQKQLSPSSGPGKKLIVILFCLYLTQGLPMGLVFHAVPTLLRSSQLSLEMTAMVPLAGLFWALKFLWSPFVDNHCIARIGYRKSWIIPMQLLMAGSIYCLSFIEIDEASLFSLMIFLAIMSFAGSTQDIATDGFAAENSQSDYLGLINTIQMSGILVGLLVAGPLALVLFEYLGYHHTYIALSVLVLLSLLPVLFWSEKVRVGQRHRAEKASLRLFFRTPLATSSLVLCSLVTVYGVVILAISRFILVDGGWSMTEIGTLTGVAHLMMMLVGCLFASVVIQWRGYRFTLAAGLVMVLFGGGLWLCLAQALISANWFVWMSALVVGLGMGLVAVSTYTYTMRFSQRTPQPGTNIAIFQSTQTLCEIVFSSIATYVAGSLGYSVVFVAGSCLALLCLVALFKLRYYAHFNQQLMPA